MKQIQLTQNKIALVDDLMFSLLVEYKWFAIKAVNTYYAATWIVDSYSPYKRRQVKMHRMVMHSDSLIDHINLNGLDNRKSNLRFTTISQNAANTSNRKISASGYKGVYKTQKKYRARIKINNKMKHLGTFTSPKEAAKAYNIAALAHFGEFARLNVIID